MNILLLQLKEFVHQAYNEMVIIKGHEVHSVSIFVDPETRKACFQVLFSGDDDGPIEYNSEPEGAKYYLLKNLCKGIKSDFSFFDSRSTVADVFSEISMQVRKHIFSQGYRKEVDFSICFVILD
jgi:hypothetical protein